MISTSYSLAGACITQNVNQECTHVLVSEYMDLKEGLIDAVVAKKPFVLDSWVEVCECILFFDHSLSSL